MNWFFGRWHRHSNYEDAIITLAKELSALRMQFASIRGSMAVGSRIAKQKEAGDLDSEVAAIQRQLGGDVVAVLDKDGKLEGLKDD